jgi:hypothetical protein
MAAGTGIINIDTQAIHMVKRQAQPRAAVPHEHGYALAYSTPRVPWDRVLEA